MKKIVIVIFLIVLFLVILILFLTRKPKEVIMECTGNMTMVLSNAELKYVFRGEEKIVKEQHLFVKLFITDENLINDYKNIMKDNKECNNFNIYDGYISYDCTYDLVNNHYYKDLEDKEGKLLFDILKNDFENDNYVCTYK